MYGRPPSSSAANRPGTRSGTSWGRGVTAAGGGLGGVIPPKTGTGIGTRAGMMPPSTSMLRPGTSLRAPTMGGDRPGTQQGVGGMPKTSYQGSGRVVQDRSYWIGELKQRMNQLGAELNKIHNDMGVLERENNSFVTLEKRAQTMGQELRDLQGQLGDYNMLIDKLHSDADLEEVQRNANEFKMKNERDQQAVDALFMERQEKEAKLKELEHQIRAEREQAAARITQMNPAAREQWNNLEAENAALLTEMAQQQAQLTSQQAQQAHLERGLQQDPARMRVWTLQEKKASIQTKIKEIQSPSTGSGEGGGGIASLDSKEAILEEIKRCNTEIAHMEGTLAEFAKEQARLAQEMQQLEAGISDEKAAKFEELVKKDREMQAFLDTFPDQAGDAATKLEQAQTDSLALLAEIQSLAVAPLGTPGDLRKLAGDLKEKEKELSTAEKTFAYVQQERERLLGDLSRIDQLETKIQGELAAAKARLEAYHADMAQFDRVDTIRAELETRRESLLATVAELRRRRAWAKLSLTAQTTRHEVKRTQLQENDTHRQLTALETKWRNVEAANSSARQQLAERAAESDYAPTKAEVLALVAECLDQNAKMVGLAL
ncbi:hypothetical protein H9P43_001401 [Blastocladiella emersonii ATCC 22665]|nr:hypothetical protein H9P43_001401 [Blastocladiella emersonii ATCC 22665]